MNIRELKFLTVAAVAALGLGLAGCGGGGSSTPTAAAPTPQETCEADGGTWADGACTTAAQMLAARQAAQRMAISTAIDTATTAVNAVDNDSTAAEVSAADAAITAAKGAIAAAADLPAEETAANTGTVTALETLLSGAKMARMDAMDADQRAADAAAMKAAAALYKGIGKTPLDADTRSAAYNTADTMIEVDLDGTGSGTAQALSEDKKTSVPALHGWTGKRYTHSVASGDNKGAMYEAVVYSGVGMPTMGAKFNAGTSDGGYELESDGTLASATTIAAGNAKYVSIDSYDLTAGTKTYKLPTSNPTGATKITPEAGSFHGVPGTYSCAPADGAPCTATKATTGLTLAGAWTFKPTNPEARVTDVKDSLYASYGWWLYTAAGGSLTASAFTDDVGDTSGTDVGGLVAGTATYSGGAAGHYALSSSTGGTNDSGRFTARAMLEADFQTDMVTGTIDNFMGNDGESRDWTVELKKAVLANDGGIARAADDDTVWTIGADAAAASGEWSGALKATQAASDTSGVPEVATGTFYSEYGTAGRMVGAFGAKKQ